LESGEKPMTRVGLPLLVAGALLLASAGLGPAQPPANPPTNPGVPAGTRTINLSLEQRHVIRELIKELKIDAAPVDGKVSAGDEVPATVELRPIPPLIGEKVPQIKAHRFYVTPAQVVIVDPQEPKVVEVIEE
jgi:hypothetical protein